MARHQTERAAVPPGGPDAVFLSAQIARRRGDIPQAAILVAKCLQELPGHQGYQDFAIEVGADLPPISRQRLAERARFAKLYGAT